MRRPEVEVVVVKGSLMMMATLRVLLVLALGSGVAAFAPISTMWCESSFTVSIFTIVHTHTRYLSMHTVLQGLDLL